MPEEGRRHSRRQTVSENAKRLTELVQRVLDGEWNAFGGEMYQVLYALALPTVRVIVLRNSEWDDCIQDAIRKLWQAIRGGDFKGPASAARSFFYTRVYWTAIDYWRKEQRRPEVLLPRDEVERWIPWRPDTGASYKELRPYARLRDCLDKLPLHLRMVVALRYFAQQNDGPRPLRDVADDLGVAHTTVERRERKALRLLRRCLGDGPDAATLPVAMC